MLTEKDLVFFNSYPDFPVDRDATSAKSELKRLAEFKGWKKGSNEHDRAIACFNCRNEVVTDQTAKRDAVSNLRTILSSKNDQSATSLANLESYLTDLNLGTKFKQDTIPPISPDARAPLNVPNPFSNNDNTGSQFSEEFLGFGTTALVPLGTKFDRLAFQKGWHPESDKYRSERVRRYEQEFAVYFGRNQKNLQAWQMICADMGVLTIPGTIEECKKAIKPYYINIYDFIEWKDLKEQQKNGAMINRGGVIKLRVFKTVRELAEYSYSQKKVYPIGGARDNGLLRELLQTLSVFRPPGSRQRQTNQEATIHW